MAVSPISADHFPTNPWTRAYRCSNARRQSLARSNEPLRRADCANLDYITGNAGGRCLLESRPDAAILKNRLPAQ